MQPTTIFDVKTDCLISFAVYYINNQLYTLKGYEKIFAETKKLIPLPFLSKNPTDHGT